MVLVLDQWLPLYQAAVQKQFAERVWFIGLQGSYGRGEANAQSDIDIVLILDSLSVEDLIMYRSVLDALPYREKICGFVAGKEELLAWDRCDLFQFCYDTLPIVGSLAELKQSIQKEDIRRAVHIGAGNIYHMCAHNFLHEKRMDIIAGCYKSALFLLQAIAFLQTGCYAAKMKDLLGLVARDEQLLLEDAFKIKEKKNLSDDELTYYSGQLLRWSAKWLREA